MKLSIGIVFCDKDYKNVSTIIRNINDNIKYEYEIITIDNRECYRNDKIDFTPTFSFNKNVKQLLARKKIIELSTGDYLWFIDADDSITNIDNLKIQDDIYIFSYEDCDKKRIFDKKRFEHYKLSNDNSSYSYSLWNKIFKKELFLGIENYVNDIEGIAMEDFMYCLYAMKNASSITVTDEIFYIKKEGVSDIKNVSDKSIIEQLSLGHKEVFAVIKLFINDSDFIDYINKNQCYFYLKKIFMIKDNIELQKECLDIIIPLFDYDIMFYIFTVFFTLDFSCQKHYEEIRDYLEKKYKKTFRNVYTTKKVVYNSDTGKDEVVEERFVCEVIYEK